MGMSFILIWKVFTIKLVVIKKNKYIIVPFNEALALDTLNDDEKYEYSIKEIQTRCQIIIENLKGIGIHSTILGTNELIDLIYSSYNRDNASQIKNITSGEFLKMTVEGEDRLQK